MIGRNILLILQLNTENDFVELLDWLMDWQHLNCEGLYSNQNLHLLKY